MQPTPQHAHEEMARSLAAGNLPMRLADVLPLPDNQAGIRLSTEAARRKVVVEALRHGIPAEELMVSLPLKDIPQWVNDHVGQYLSEEDKWLVEYAVKQMIRRRAIEHMQAMQRQRSG